jgi:hypothetical protein
MGGLVAADVALLCRHQIIGVINFDVPFLGMHPGIIKAGLGSIFSPWPEPKDQTAEEPDPAGKRVSRFNTLFNPRPNDPNYNPPFPNDVHLPVRKGWENTLHWLNKHSNGIVQASKSLVRSHFEFGSAMADYRTLKARYAKIRALEEEDERQRASALQEVYRPPRIRFVNYYTTSTGRPKKPKSPKPSSPSPSRSESRSSQVPEGSAMALASPDPQLEINTHASDASTVSPRVSIDSSSEEDVLDVVPPTPIEEVDLEPSVGDIPTEAASGPELPDIPPIPQEPPFVDLAQFPDRSQRKAAEKEHDQALKEYQRAVKARNKVFNDRDKIQERWEKQKKKDQQLMEKQAQQAQQDETTQTGKELRQEDKQTQKDLVTAQRAKGKDKVESGRHIEPNHEDVGAVYLGGGNTSRSTSTNGPYGNYDFSRSAIMNHAEPNEQASYNTGSNAASSYNESMYSLATADSNVTNPGLEAQPKAKRLRKFCMLPPEDSKGNKDPTWVRVFMEGIDEVTAHTTLFFVNDTYERLVGEVGARIEDWVSEADSLRLVREMEGL